MENENPSNKGKVTPNLDSVWTRALLPAAVALAWYLSEIQLVPECERLHDWKIFGIALSVFCLAGIGPRDLVYHRKWISVTIAMLLLAIGLVAGGYVEKCTAVASSPSAPSTMVPSTPAPSVPAPPLPAPSTPAQSATTQPLPVPTLSYITKLVYAFMHAFITASLSILTFLAFTPAKEPRRAPAEVEE